MWGWVWTLLVVAALVFLGWIAWGVVRSGLRLMREAARAGESFDAASQRMAQAVADAEADRSETSATMFDERDVLRARVQERRLAALQRRDVRRARQSATWRVWTTSSWLDRRRAARGSAHGSR